MTTSSLDATVPLYRICPRCGGKGRVPDDSARWGAYADHCEVPCPDCRMRFVVAVAVVETAGEPRGRLPLGGGGQAT